MRNLMKKFSVVLIFALVVSLLPVNSGKVEAALKKNIKRTLYVGQKLQLNVVNQFGGKIKAKKVKWSSSNKKVATVSKKGLVKAKKKGKTTITAKYKKQKFSCKLTVKKLNNNQAVVPVLPTPAPVITPPPTPTPIPNNVLAQNIVANVQKLASGDVLYTVTNNNTIPISDVKLNVMYYNATGMPVKSDTASFDDIAVGGVLYEVGSLTSDDLAKIDMTKTQVSVTVTNYLSSISITKYVTESVSVTGSVGEDNKVFITYVNPTAQNVWVTGTIFYRDANNNILAAREIIESVAAGATIFEDYLAPYYKETVEGSHKAYDDIPYVTADWVYRAYYY